MEEWDWIRYCRKKRKRGKGNRTEGIFYIFDTVKTKLNLTKFAMMDTFEKQDGNDKEENIEIFSKSVRAGKRTYFFDVKATKSDDYYVTITESKKRIGKDGQFFYDKHKIFLYKEDFDKFADGLQDVVDFIKNAQGNPELYHRMDDDQEVVTIEEGELTNGFADFDFDDLGKK